MKILIWSPFVNLGGGIRLLSSLTGALAQHPEINELALAIPPDSASAFATIKGSLRLLIIPKPPLLRWMEASDDSSESARISKKLLKRLRPNTSAQFANRRLNDYAQAYDVVYVFWPHGSPIPFIPKPIVCTYQDSTVLDFPEILGGARTDLERQYALSWVTQARGLVTSSETVRNNLTGYFGEGGARATVIYHNILPTMTSASSSNDSLPELPERYLVYAANLNAHKNHDTLLNAWARFVAREKMPLVLVGEYTHILKPGWDAGRNHYWVHDHVAGLVRRRKLEHGRDFYALGYVSDEQMERIMRGAAGVIMASLSEGGGSFPAEEALSYGVPLLCSDIPVMREHLGKRSAEIVWFDPLSTDSILNALEQFQRDYTRYHASAQQGMSDPRPTWAEIADQYVQVFKEAISSSLD
jgi:glycosyltransferase involved in cell wall biosynthesis